MSPIAISLITCAFVFGGALLGIGIRTLLPDNHLAAESKDAIKLGMGLVATLTALVLGLLISSAKSSFDMQNNELTEMSSKIVLLDRVLAHYGSEAKEARDELRNLTVRAFDWVSPKNSADAYQSAPSTKGEALYDKIQGLSPMDDVHRSIQTQALGLVLSLGQTRWLISEQRVTSVPIPLVIVVIFWLTVLFISFGLFAPRNGSVVTSLLVSALSVSGAILLILEMYSPHAGIIRISSAPLRAALAHLGQ
jgi:hypothetical protein